MDYFEKLQVVHIYFGLISETGKSFRVSVSRSKRLGNNCNSEDRNVQFP